jgi:hypothetical protein
MVVVEVGWTDVLRDVFVNLDETTYTMRKLSVRYMGNEHLRKTYFLNVDDVAKDLGIPCKLSCSVFWM